MKIATFSRSIPAHGGGGMEKVAWDLMRQWVSMGHEVACYTTPVPRPIEHSHGIVVHQLNGRPGRYSRTWWVETARIASTLDADVILGIGMGAHRIAMSGVAEMPVVMQAHGTSIDELRTKWAVRSPRAIATIPLQVARMINDMRAYPKYDKVIAIGPSVAASLERYPERLRPKQTVVISNAAPPPHRIGKQVARKYLGVPEKARVALAVGRLHSEKGFERAIDLVAASDAVLVIAGDGPEQGALMKQAKKLGVDSRTHFLGRVDASDMPSVYSASDVVLMPSRRIEGLPLVALEASSYGLPILASPSVMASMDDATPTHLLALNQKNLSEALDHQHDEQSNADSTWADCDVARMYLNEMCSLSPRMQAIQR